MCLYIKFPYLKGSCLLTYVARHASALQGHMQRVKVRIQSFSFHVIQGFRYYDTFMVERHTQQAGITLLIIHMTKLLDSDWLRAVQFKCNTSAN